MRQRWGADCVQSALDVMNTEAGVVNTPPRARTRVVCPPCSHTEILKESSCSRTTRTRMRAKAPIRDRDAYFRAWRDVSFGGDFDPVRIAVDEAVAAFSTRQPDSDRAIWLKVANEIGYKAFLDFVGGTDLVRCHRKDSFLE